MHATDRFIYLVDRLHRAGLRSAGCITDEERRCAQRWLVLWNRALKLEHGRREWATDANAIRRAGRT